MNSPIHTLFAILSNYNRCRELRRLVSWAERKRLTRPHRLYRFRLQDAEVRLAAYQLRYPRLCRIAWIVHCFNGLCFPAPAYPRSGLAQDFRRSTEGK